jgi:hypothetical protein
VTNSPRALSRAYARHRAVQVETTSSRIEGGAS